MFLLFFQEKKMLLENLKPNDKTAPKELLQLFKKAGAHAKAIAQSSVEKTKRTNGVTFNEIILVMSDSQNITLRVKTTGDIYQVLLNKKILPIKEQDNIQAAVKEVINAWQKNANKFQLALTRKKMPLPKGIASTRKSIIERLKAHNEELKKLITERETELNIAPTN